MTAVTRPAEQTIALNHSAGRMPALGFGTLISDSRRTRELVTAAIKAGFRHLDAAERYRNEADVGLALRDLFADGTIAREDVFITTKLWNNNHRPERVRPALEASLRRLGLDAVDLYLMHTPFAFAPGDDQDPRDEAGRVIQDDGVTLEETWAAMEALVDEGLTRAIGLSDIDTPGVRRVVASARIKPAVVEVESHPYHPQWDLHRYCQSEDIVLLAFAPLGHALEPRVLDDPVVVTIARELGKTPAQVLLAWGIQRGGAVLTSTVSHTRLSENFDVTALPDEAVERISQQLTTRHRFNSVVDAGEPGFREVPAGS
ncbi:dehydrogenase [Mycobacterium sp. 852013-50091_SCH5140682]|uniref:aldo/keto reductase n=1 Tax=Mycobacterium sp. 852013-50091_SCH5140682 TaxID=1834109 RepID=UPI0007E9740C|nr:aldo/keto reductase [Mycobacterium sp. 852013-50091_SCH5140682]OBC00128.1 dehydrogenase [Mycobacterium sp. 852013-50091_SCH5140682]